ncbi:MAG: L,D-transpeptidase [Anaerolineae bacterium]|nr:L,D-transpeptidase [Anaerolineae bacterium]
MGTLAATPWRYWLQQGQDWPDAEKFGRVCLGKVNIRTRPHPDAPTAKEIYDDAVVVWLREVVGAAPGYGSRRWVETPDGYIYAPRLQPSFNRPNPPLDALPGSGDNRGMWAEVTVPFVDIIIANPPIRTPSLKDKLFTRLYYSQVVWIDDIKIGSSGKPLYRINQKFGTYGDLFWADAEAFRPITSEEMQPISPDVENKKIVVNVIRQTLSAYEDDREVMFTRVSTGAKFDAYGNAVDKWSTPLGPHPIYRKLMSLHMSGQTTGDYTAVPWTCFITGEGVAVHSTYWHNEFGVPRSHGCINMAPEDAKWVFRWTRPYVPVVPGELDVSSQWPPVGSIVEVVE